MKNSYRNTNSTQYVHVCDIYSDSDCDIKIIWFWLEHPCAQIHPISFPRLLYELQAVSLS